MKKLAEYVNKTLNGEEIKAEIMTDGYGILLIQKYIQNELFKTEYCEKFDLNTVKQIAENWVENNKI